MLTVKNVSKTYPNNLIKTNNDISFTIENGNMVWISGSTGSGKTTLLNILSAIDNVDEGQVFWNNHNITDMTATEKAKFRLANMGIVFQSLELIKSQNAFNNVALPLRYLGLDEKTVHTAVSDIFNYLNIEELIGKLPTHMSGGQQQRVALARSLVNKPTHILGDEISSALDSSTAHFIYEKISQYVKEYNAVAVLISHDETINNYVDQHLVMSDGKLGVK
mgnify:CR=1 FL=1